MILVQVFELLLLWANGEGEPVHTRILARLHLSHTQSMEDVEASDYIALVLLDASIWALKGAFCVYSRNSKIRTSVFRNTRLFEINVLDSENRAYSCSILITV